MNISPSCGAEKTNAKIQARNICQKLDIFKGQLVMEMEVMFNASLHKSLKFTSPLTMMTWQIENPLKVCNFDKYVKLFLELFYFFSSFFKKTESPCVSFLVVSRSAETFTLFMAMRNNVSFIRADEDGGKDENFFPSFSGVASLGISPYPNLRHQESLVIVTLLNA